jgi:hypothetical protein
VGATTTVGEPVKRVRVGRIEQLEPAADDIQKMDAQNGDSQGEILLLYVLCMTFCDKSTVLIAVQ